MSFSRCNGEEMERSMDLTAKIDGEEEVVTGVAAAAARETVAVAPWPMVGPRVQLIVRVLRIWKWCEVRVVLVCVYIYI